MAESKYYTISEKVHEKKGTVIYVVRLEDKVSRKIFNELSDLARNHDGYYSSYSGVNGFVFPTREDAELFGTEVDNTHKSKRKKKSVKSDEEELIEILKGQYTEELTSVYEPTNTEASDYDYTGALPLPEALKRVIDNDGEIAITDLKTVNVLSDFQAYKDFPSAKYVLQSIIAENYGKRFFLIGSWDTKAQQLIDKFIAETGFQQAIVDYLFQSIAYALGWIKTMPSITSSTPTPMPTPQPEVNLVYSILNLTQSQLWNMDSSYQEQYAEEAEQYLNSIIKIVGNPKSELNVEIGVNVTFDTFYYRINVNVEMKGKVKIKSDWGVTFYAVIKSIAGKVLGKNQICHLYKGKAKKQYNVDQATFSNDDFRTVGNISEIIIYWE